MSTPGVSPSPPERISRRLRIVLILVTGVAFGEVVGLGQGVLDGTLDEVVAVPVRAAGLGLVLALLSWWIKKRRPGSQSALRWTGQWLLYLAAVGVLLPVVIASGAAALGLLYIIRWMALPGYSNQVPAPYVEFLGFAAITIGLVCLLAGALYVTWKDY